jgi:hypothetical protein
VSAGATQSTGNALGAGQNGRNAIYAGNGAEGNGGGGGGYWGGLSKQTTGDASDAAGGGGSSFVNTTLFTSGVGGTQGANAADGKASITWMSW